jgi:hypothetical protein
MGQRNDLQELIPESYREIVEAVPRGFPRSAVTGALLLGALTGSLWTYIVPRWLAGAILAVLVVASFTYRLWSDKVFDQRMAFCRRVGLDCETKEDRESL